MRERWEKWENGVMVDSGWTDDSPAEEIDLRNALDNGIAAMQAIQALNHDTLAKANTSIHTIAMANEKLYKWLKTKI